MDKRRIRLATLLLAATVTASGGSLKVQAAGSSGLASVLPSAGVSFTVNNMNTTLRAVKNSENCTATTSTEIEDTFEKKEDKIVKVSGELDAGEEQLSKQEIEAKEEEKTFKSLVIAQVNRYVNVRDLPSETEGKIVGKLYDKSAGTFIEEVDGWYKIQSGSVTGYVKGEFCVTGDAAVELAKQVGTRIATVTTTTLKVREEPTTESSVLGLVPIEDELLVLEELDGWVKINIEEGDGYVSTDYVTLSTEFVKAESLAEERARIEKAEREKKAAAEAAAKARRESAASQGNSESAQAAPAPVVTASGGSEYGNAVANYALQFVGNPYVFGGTSLTNGADCSGFVMSVYQNFGINLPHSSSADRKVGYAVEGGLAAAQPGDLICYSGHVALYIGNGQIVHASTAKTGIKVSDAAYRKVLAVRRIF